MGKKYKINFYKYGDWTPHDFQKGRKKNGEKKTKTKIKDFEIEDTDKLETIRKEILEKLNLPDSNTCRWQLTIKGGIAGPVLSERNNFTFKQLTEAFKKENQDFPVDQATTLNLFEGPGKRGKTKTTFVKAKINKTTKQHDFLNRNKNKDSNKPEKDTNKRQSLFTRIEKTASFGQKPKNSKVISGGHRSTVKQNIKRFEKLSKKK